MSIFELLLFQYNQTGRHTFPVSGPHGLEGNYQYTCTLLKLFFSSSSYCLLLTHSVCLSHSLCVVCFCKSVCSLSKKKKKREKVTKFARALSFPLIWIQSCKVHVGSRLASTAAQRANCVQQHHSVTRWLTNALAIVVFDRDTNTQNARRRSQHTSPLWCSHGSLVVAARLFWWWSVSRLVHMLFWSPLSEPSELTQTQLAWVEPSGVHRELKDMDSCQHISYIAHILQVQLRIRDRGPSPPCCPPYHLPAWGWGLCGLASTLASMTALPSINLSYTPSPLSLFFSSLLLSSFLFSSPFQF